MCVLSTNHNRCTYRLLILSIPGHSAPGQFLLKILLDNPPWKKSPTRKYPPYIFQAILGQFLGQFDPRTSPLQICVSWASKLMGFFFAKVVTVTLRLNDSYATGPNLGGTWRRICSPDIRNVSALEVLRNRALQIHIYLLTYLLTYLIGESWRRSKCWWAKYHCWRACVAAGRYASLIRTSSPVPPHVLDHTEVVRSTCPVSRNQFLSLFSQLFEVK